MFQMRFKTNYFFKSEFSLMQVALQCPKPDWSFLSTILVILFVTRLRKKWLKNPNLYINIEVLRVLQGAKMFGLKWVNVCLKVDWARSHAESCFDPTHFGPNSLWPINFGQTSLLPIDTSAFDKGICSKFKSIVSRSILGPKWDLVISNKKAKMNGPKYLGPMCVFAKVRCSPAVVGVTLTKPRTLGQIWDTHFPSFQCRCPNEQTILKPLWPKVSYLVFST